MGTRWSERDATIRAVTFVAFGAALGACGPTMAGLKPYRELILRPAAPAVVMLPPASPDPRSVLRDRALPVDPADPDLPRLVEQMRARLEQTGGVGLAAPQVGVSRRVILVKHGTRPAGSTIRIEAYINPRLEWASSEQGDDYEACLSFDGGGGLVPRAKRVRVSFAKVGGERQTVELADWDARIMQHELDHLEGVLFLDRLRGPLLPIEEMRRCRDERHRARGWLPPLPTP
jgi:peptide deformylase